LTEKVRIVENVAEALAGAPVFLHANYFRSPPFPSAFLTVSGFGCELRLIIAKPAFVLSAPVTLFGACTTASLRLPFRKITMIEDDGDSVAIAMGTEFLRLGTTAGKLIAQVWNGALKPDRTAPIDIHFEANARACGRRFPVLPRRAGRLLHRPGAGALRVRDR
jgi:hypothetical protein